MPLCSHALPAAPEGPPPGPQTARQPEPSSKAGHACTPAGIPPSGHAVTPLALPWIHRHLWQIGFPICQIGKFSGSSDLTAVMSRLLPGGKRVNRSPRAGESRCSSGPPPVGAGVLPQSCRGSSVPQGASRTAEIKEAWNCLIPDGRGWNAWKSLQDSISREGN